MTPHLKLANAANAFADIEVCLAKENSTLSKATQNIERCLRNGWSALWTPSVTVFRKADIDYSGPSYTSPLYDILLLSTTLTTKSSETIPKLGLPNRLVDAWAFQNPDYSPTIRLYAVQDATVLQFGLKRKSLIHRTQSVDCPVCVATGSTWVSAQEALSAYTSTIAQLVKSPEITFKQAREHPVIITHD